MPLTTPNGHGLRAERLRGNQRVEEKEMEAERRARHRNDAIKLNVGRRSETHADATRSAADAPPDWSRARRHVNS